MTEERLLSQANIKDTMRCKQATGIMPTVCGALHRAADQKGATPTEFQSDIAACWLPEGPGLAVLVFVFSVSARRFDVRTDARTVA